MTVLASFLQDSSSTLGVFYPTHYIISAFNSFQDAEEAAQALHRNGLTDQEVLALRSEQMLAFFEEFRANSGLWSGVMTMLSRTFGTEQVFADDDVNKALAGAGFLAVHSPTEEAAQSIKAAIMPFKPKTMDWYRGGAVQTLI
jgi:hypothetical protein